MIGAGHDSLHTWLASNGGGLCDHVVSSTVILLFLLAASMLPFLRPRTRYALVLIGVAKFLVPAGIFRGFVGRLATSDASLPSLSMATVLALPSPASPEAELLCEVTALWLLGALAMLVRVIATQLHWRPIVRDAGTVSHREVEAMAAVAGGSSLRSPPRVARSPAGLPLTAGFIRPVVLLPDCCAAALDDDELRAVVAHELAHAERHDNLGGVIESAALTLFWFNPLLWIARNCLHAEAEKDCDERVLDFVPDPPTYLSGMLKVSYGFIAPQRAGVSCMSTSRLKERMDHLMKQQQTPPTSIPHRLAVMIGVVAVALTTLVVSAGEEKETPLRAGKAGVSLPKIVHTVQPVYPEAAREKRIQGMVVVTAVIDKGGNVIETSIAKGVEGAEGAALEEAATAAVKQWKFKPAMKKGKPVLVTFNVTVRFKLH